MKHIINKKKNTQKASPWDGGKNKKQIIFYYLHGLKTNKSLNRGAPKSERVSEQAGLIKGYVVDGSTFWLQILNKGFNSSISLKASHFKFILAP